MLAALPDTLYKSSVSEFFDPKIAATQTAEEGEKLIADFKQFVNSANAEHAFVSHAVYLLGQWLNQHDKTGWTDPNPALIELAAFLLFPLFGNTQERNPETIQALIDLIASISQSRCHLFAFLPAFVNQRWLVPSRCGDWQHEGKYFLPRCVRQ